MAHFSSTTGKALCRVNAGKVVPASKRRGPFVIPIPGYELRQVSIDIIPGNCTEKDWTTLVRLLTELRRFTLREEITVRLMDEDGKDTSSVWYVSGVPSLRTSTTDRGGNVLLFSSRDATNLRAPLLLFRDSSSGDLMLQSPPVHPGYLHASR